MKIVIIYIIYHVYPSKVRFCSLKNGFCGEDGIWWHQYLPFVMCCIPLKTLKIHQQFGAGSTSASSSGGPNCVIGHLMAYSMKMLWIFLWRIFYGKMVVKICLKNILWENGGEYFYEHFYEDLWRSARDLRWWLDHFERHFEMIEISMSRDLFIFFLSEIPHKLRRFI